MKITIIFLLLHLSLFASESTETSIHNSETAKNAQNVQVKTAYVGVSDVPRQAVKALVELKSIQERIEKEKEQIRNMHEAVTSYADSISLLLQSTNYQTISTKNLRELQKMQSELAVYLKQLGEWEDVLKGSISIYDENSELLKDHLVLWSQTRTNAVKENAPSAILEQIASVTTDIEALKSSLKTEYDQTLTDSQIITTKISTLNEIDIKLKQREVSVRNQIFYQDKAPLFTLYSQNSFSFFTYIEGIQNTIVDKYNEILVYFQTHTELFPFFTIITILSMSFIIYFNHLYRQRKLFVQEESFHKKTFLCIGRPFVTFFILLVLIITGIFPDRPVSLIEMVLIFLTIPVIRVLQTVVKQEHYKYIYIIFALYTLYMIEKNSIAHELESRMFMLLINVALLFTISTIWIKKVLYGIGYNFITKMGNYILALFVLLLFVAVGANLYGSALLSERLISGILLAIYSSMVFYALYTILSAYVVILLRRRISTASHMLEKYSRNIENTTKLLIKIWMFSWWFLLEVKMVGIYPYLVTIKNDILALSWQVSETTISVQSIFDFIFIVVGTWILARVIRTVLEVEVFARFTFPRGMPTAIITVSNYIIVISGTIIAFSSLGVTAQQFALIFGALGVGIGFGLRNIIANFVSGVIMVFERPVQIGDVIEVDKTMGEVQSIGPRASTLKTFDGSEVIIPNADFIAKEITNWTLSDKHRRKVVDFKVGFDSDIELILKIMKEVALAHPDVLKEPEPLATFQGFGEYYLEFKLYFWLSSNLIVASSDVSIGIYKALKKAGITMPVQKTQLKSDDL